MNGADTETASRPLAFSTLSRLGPVTARRSSASEVYSPEPSQARGSNRTAVSTSSRSASGGSAGSMIASARICPR